MRKSNYIIKSRVPLTAEYSKSQFTVWLSVQHWASETYIKTQGTQQRPERKKWLGGFRISPFSLLNFNVSSQGKAFPIITNTPPQTEADPILQRTPSNGQQPGEIRAQALHKQQSIWAIRCRCAECFLDFIFQLKWFILGFSDFCTYRGTSCFFREKNLYVCLTH